MRRTLSTDDSQAVSLFPFLAVLLSTMGALLLILVVMARQARLQAAQEEEAGRARKATAAPDARDGEESVRAEQHEQQEQLRAMLARLDAVRQAGLSELEASRQRLRHADQHLRDLQDEVADLYRQLQSLEELDTSRLEDQQQAERELERLKELIRETEERLDEQRKAAEDAPPSYAIIPYEGPHGTSRRPLYIECRRDAVVLQPEGIELSFRDFQGPLGPGNPLASALRASEEYYASGGSANSAEGEPYPLVLVRPDGIATYYYVRKALEGWGAEFGYELLDGDWQLEFPLPNPQVANVQQRAIDLARARQQALAMAAPRRYGGGGGYGDGDADDGADGFFGGLTSRVASTVSAEGGGASQGNPQGGRSGTPDRYASTSGEGWASGPGGDGGERSGAEMSGGIAPDSSGSRTNPGRNETQSNRYGNGSGTGRAGQDRYAQGAHPASQGDLQTRDGQRAENSADRSGRLQGGGAGGQMPSGGPAPRGGQASGARAGASQQGSPSGNGGPGGGPSAGGTPSLVQPLAETRGTNWAVPEAGTGAVPVRRAIHVVVRRDRLAILPEAGASGGRVIPIADSLPRAVDPFVDAIDEHIEQWGTAGRGLYWQPILVLKPGPDGVGHASALQRLLNASGLELAHAPGQE